MQLNCDVVSCSQERSVHIKRLAISQRNQALYIVVPLSNYEKNYLGLLVPFFNSRWENVITENVLASLKLLKVLPFPSSFQAVSYDSATDTGPLIFFSIELLSRKKNFFKTFFCNLGTSEMKIFDWQAPKWFESKSVGILQSFTWPESLKNISPGHLKRPSNT